MNAKTLGRIESFIHSNKYLIFIIIGLFLVRLPSLLEPLWYGDEAIYVVIGQEINRGSLLYVDIFDHKTPGIYYLAAWSMKILGSTIWSFKFLLAVWLIPTMIAFYHLAKILFDKKTAVISSLVLALLLATPALEGNIVNSEILMILPTSLALIFGFKKKYFWAGVFFSLTLLLKFPGIFDFGAFFIFLAISLDKKHFKETVKNLFILTIGFLIPFSLTFVYFAFKGALSAYINSAFLFNLTYTNYGNEFIIPNGLLIVKALPLFGILVYALWRIFSETGRRFGKKLGIFEFLIIWLIFSYYGAVFGGRTYIHYLIQPLAALSIIIGATIKSAKFRRPGISVIIITIALSLALGFLPNLNPKYYTNLTNLTQSDPTEFQNGFDSNTSRNYAVASFISGCVDNKLSDTCENLRSNEEDSIYLWANQPSIYFLSKRKPASKYITAFHVLGDEPARKQVVQDIRKNNPIFIIVDSSGPEPYPELDSLISSRYNLLAISEDYKIYEPSENSLSK